MFNPQRNSAGQARPPRKPETLMPCPPRARVRSPCAVLGNKPKKHTALLSDDAFDFDYDGGVHTAKAIGNITDINHDVEVKERRGAAVGQSYPSEVPPCLR